MIGMNHYDVLQVSGVATQDQIRANFLRLAKQYHPDKAASTLMDNWTSNKSFLSSNGTDALDFATLQRAYEILSNNESRRVYDAELKARDKYSPVAARIDVDELEENEADSAELQYPCRCGDGFYIRKEHIAKSHAKEITVPCSSCSFHIVIELS